jgi:uncharacterized OsmC-like protein
MKGWGNLDMIKISPKVANYMRGVLRMREIEKDPEKFKLLTEVEVELHEDIRTRASQPGTKFSWISDYVPWDSRAARGPSPLEYFIASMPMCHLSHYSEEASVMSINLDSIKIRAKGRFDNRPGIGYEEISYETRIQSPNPRKRIIELVERAEGACFVTSTLKRAVSIRGVIYLNDKELVKRMHQR